MRQYLEQTVEKNSMTKDEKDQQYSIFAEQYLEEPIYGGRDNSASFSVTICTWRGIPTIDDW